MARGLFNSEPARRSLIPSNAFLSSTTETKAVITITIHQSFAINGWSRFQPAEQAAT
jgi:hypothetical protein